MHLLVDDFACITGNTAQLRTKIDHLLLAGKAQSLTLHAGRDIQLALQLVAQNGSAGKDDALDVDSDLMVGQGQLVVVRLCEGQENTVGVGDRRVL